MKWTLNTLRFKEEIIVQLPCLLMASGALEHVPARLEQQAQDGSVCLSAPGSHVGLGQRELTAASV